MNKRKKNKIPKLKAISLFANVGIAEAYLEEMGVDVVLANELDAQRAKFYSHLYPSTEMIVGDITNLDIQNELIRKALDKNVDLLIATPPCQGMSTAGKKDEFDPRNSLVCCAVKLIKEIMPKFVLLENVPEQLLTHVKIEDELLLIPQFLKKELNEHYNFAEEVVIDAADYEVPQSRQRAIFLLTRKDIGFTWQMPEKSETKVTMSNIFLFLFYYK